MYTIAPPRDLADVNKFKALELFRLTRYKEVSSVARLESPFGYQFSLRSLLRTAAEILGPVSSSLLPPSLARERFATLFCADRAALGGPISLSGALRLGC